MGYWWRAYDEAVDDPKLHGLSDVCFRFWFNLCCVCSKFGGNLPPTKHIAFALRIQERKVERLLGELRDKGLIDDDNQGCRMHNWHQRQYKSDRSTERVKRFRDRQETAPENREQSTENRVQNTETDSSLRSENARARERPSEVEVLNNDFEEFWKIYPHKVGRKAAQKAFATAMKSGSINFDRLMFGLAAYVSKTDDRPWCNPATWLNQGRWDDKPAEDPRNGRSALAAADRLIEKFGGVDAAKAYVPGSSGPAPLGLDFGESPPSPKRISSR